MKCFTAYLFLLSVAFIVCVASSSAQTGNKLTPEQEAHVKSLALSLDQADPLRIAIDHGYRGSGIRYPWMDEMKRSGIKLVTYSIDFVWNKSIKSLSISEVNYFDRYYYAGNDQQKVERKTAVDVPPNIRSVFGQAAISRARTRLPYTIRNLKRLTDSKVTKVCGTLYVHLLDDETLPTLEPPANIFDVDPRPDWCQ